MTTGTMATGTFTADDLVGPLEGATLEEFADEMAAGNTHTNIHTEEFPDGEIRGQIAEVVAETEDDADADEEEADEVEQPERVDAGAGGTVQSAGPASLVIAVALAPVLGIAVVTRRRREPT